ncbi:MAG: M20/M25/M40 family metallo-hydrolase [Bacteroidetes bacterium]|nr:M20/M25/M40 family metallo-hydrolase [Bacteroidota bacterium]
MNRLLLILVILLPFPGRSQPEKYSMAHNNVVERIKSDLSVLASDSLQGRESGTAGEEKAYHYISDQFRKIRLAPAGNDSGSYLQPFPHAMPDYRNSAKRNHLSVDQKSFRYYYDFGATRFSADTSGEGPLFIPGASFYEDNRIAEGTSPASPVAGKVILLDLSEFRDLKNPSGLQHKLKAYLEQLFDGGSICILLWDSRGSLPRSLFDFSQPDPLQGPVTFITRATANELLQHSNATVSFSVHQPASKNTLFHNVVGKIDHHSKETIIIGAHYDHMGKGPGKSRKKSDTLTMYGADDNASGTAGMLELARYFMQSGDTSVNYIFVAFSGEEEGLLGSKFFCDHLPSGIGNVRFMVNFDMIGRLGCDGNEVTVLGKGSSPYWKNLYRQVDHPAFGIRAVWGAPAFSDHYPFLEKQVPVIYLTTGLHPQYHTSADRVDRINFTGLAELVSYSESLINRAKKEKKIPYREIPGITQFFSTLEMVIKEL